MWQRIHYHLHRGIYHLHRGIHVRPLILVKNQPFCLWSNMVNKLAYYITFDGFTSLRTVVVSNRNHIFKLMVVVISMRHVFNLGHILKILGGCLTFFHVYIIIAWKTFLLFLLLLSRPFWFGDLWLEDDCKKTGLGIWKNLEHRFFS